MAFEGWLAEKHGYRFSLSTEGAEFIRPSGAQGSIPAQLHEFPTKGLFLTFMEAWPSGVPLDHIFWIFEHRLVGDSVMQRVRLPDRKLLTVGSDDLFLIPLAECLEDLVLRLRRGEIRCWGRPYTATETPEIRLHVEVPRAAFLGEPLLDWVDGTLGAVSHSRWSEGHRFPDLPLFIDLQFDKDEITARRLEEVDGRRDAYLNFFPADQRAQAALSWPKLTALSSPTLPEPEDGPSIDQLGEPDAVVRPVPPVVTTASARVSATREFRQRYAIDGTAVGPWASKGAILAELTALFPGLVPHQYTQFIWKPHAPDAWKRQGRPKR